MACSLFTRLTHDPARINTDISQLLQRFENIMATATVRTRTLEKLPSDGESYTNARLLRLKIPHIPQRPLKHINWMWNPQL